MDRRYRSFFGRKVSMNPIFTLRMVRPPNYRSDSITHFLAIIYLDNRVKERNPTFQARASWAGLGLSPEDRLSSRTSATICDLPTKVRQSTASSRRAKCRMKRKLARRGEREVLHSALATGGCPAGDLPLWIKASGRSFTSRLRRWRFLCICQETGCSCPRLDDSVQALDEIRSGWLLRPCHGLRRCSTDMLLSLR